MIPICFNLAHIRHKIKLKITKRDRRIVRNDVYFNKHFKGSFEA